MKRVLLYLGKFPEFGFDVDGGSILAKQLIDSLKKVSILDLAFIRKNKEEYYDDAVNSIQYVEYIDPFNNKFVRRLKNLSTNREAIGEFSKYDVIITAHISKFFGFKHYGREFWDKTILFPMFCSPSYIQAGEIVPDEYIHQEKIVLENVAKIISPSVSEKQQIVNIFGVSPDKIRVVYRGINPQFYPSPEDKLKQIKKNITITCIGSFKPQKNNMSAVRVLRELLLRGVPCHLNLVGTVQDESIFSDVIKFINHYELTQNVSIFHEIRQAELAKLLRESDLNLSVSNWETFGRGIFEGIVSGLPTFVYSHLSCVRDVCQQNPGVIFCNDEEDMIDRICQLIKSPEEYVMRQTALKEIAEKLSYQMERNTLIKELLG